MLPLLLSSLHKNNVKLDLNMLLSSGTLIQHWKHCSVRLYFFIFIVAPALTSESHIIQRWILPFCLFVKVKLEVEFSGGCQQWTAFSDILVACTVHVWITCLAAKKKVCRTVCVFQGTHKRVSVSAVSNTVIHSLYAPACCFLAAVCFLGIKHFSKNGFTETNVSGVVLLLIIG